MIRAKFLVTEVRKVMNTIQTAEGYKRIEMNEVTLNPVMDDGSEENKKFFAWTPSGKITLGMIRETGFELDKQYYVDFTKAEEAKGE